MLEDRQLLRVAAALAGESFGEETVENKEGFADRLERSLFCGRK